jgi:DNA-binding CsgD family transcriptional regulator
MNTNACLLSVIGDIKLTPAETRVLLKVVEFGGVSETARNLNIAESTVKTHLGRIFIKTDTQRQADLVKLVAGFASPVNNRMILGFERNAESIDKILCPDQIVSILKRLPRCCEEPLRDRPLSGRLHP